MKIDHVVILVDDLEAASAEYRDQGFTVVQGGEHKAFGSHNALVAFADGTYLELAAFKQSSSHNQRPAEFDRRLAAGESRLSARWLSMNGLPAGLIDFAMIPDGGGFAALRERGIDIAELQMGRARPDGVELEWRMGHPATLDLPFFVSDITPREWRVPAEIDHANGAAGIAELHILVHDVAESSARYERLLQQTTKVTAQFQCGGTIVKLVEPLGAKAQGQLQERGESLHRVILHGSQSIVLE